MSHPALHVRDLAFSYGSSDAFALRIPSLRLDAGEAMLLRARSGGGKSTLLLLIAGLLDPQSGSVEVNATNVHALRGTARDAFRGRSIGMVFQTHHLVTGLSALENVLLAPLMAGLRPDAQSARDLLARLGIERPMAQAEELSVGQQQRVAIARALICKPLLVLADEPTASLDPDNAGQAIALLRECCGAAGAALLCVSHDPEIADRFERVESLDALRAQEAGV